MNFICQYDYPKDGADFLLSLTEALLAAGYEFLTVSELLARDGEPAENCVNYYND